MHLEKQKTAKRVQLKTPFTWPIPPTNESITREEKLQKMSQTFKNRERKGSKTQKKKGNREENTPLKLTDIKMPTSRNHDY